MDFLKVINKKFEEKKTFISPQTYLYIYGSQNFEVLWSYILNIVQRFA